MRIASFTMIGQFPDGIDLHVRNLRWSLTDEDHIYVVTLPEYINQYALTDGENITYIPHPHDGEGNFVNFWSGFPALLRRLAIAPQWFLFMEEDIWFHHRPDNIPADPLQVMNYLPLQKHYHATMVGDKMFHARVWEGANLVHGGIVHRAVDRGINFSFAKEFFYQREPGWEEKVGGPISLRYFHNKPDTFDEFSLYCALWERTNAAYVDRAVHLRGPESLHRQFPALYNGCSEEVLKTAQEKLNYLCVYAATASYYIAGNWSAPADWRLMKPTYKDEYRKLLPTASEWMTPSEFTRLQEIVTAF